MAMSTSGPRPEPTCSPAYSIGVSSFSPSPMTITPRIGMVPRTGRMASTAAPSTSILVAPAEEPGSGHGRCFGGSDQFQCQNAVVIKGVG